ncbi:MULTISPECIES: APC family permease [Streptomycetaceae]|uniref:YbeC n=1 Tax=Streptantibioticus cattleyicolor (strain ATCC 35852 / DSM 46488 / JCM 4925 / NBRC 14057 / NRRL 8057) TaxID=1003195 RepID=F8K3I9_STREN|nr:MULTISPECIES: APC family permease [Streptomycetaceae]AEW96308.1 YbeC [Streptantibioticus cattleyicolor NRRL 8057 = DSM 46488]MYS60823.1 amino acid permease [Streptomyces sp. SID5468]CCB76647.1 putative H+/amino acid transporter [Streptantibioticus cattleyicolor NRRL 8057 = DSM 46488]
MSGSNYRRSLGTVSLTAVGLGSIIGSGWLFGAAKASHLAGPAAVLAWVIGAVVALTIALTYTELGSMFPKAGGMVRYGQYSHGSLAGYLAAWANWIAIVSVIPGEATASVQYMSSWKWAWAQGLYNGKELTGSGVALASVLLIIYFVLNWFAITLFAKTNTAITVFKIVVPTLTAATLMLAHFDTHNLHSAGGFAPHGWNAVFNAVAVSGIVWAYNGFQSPLNMAAEARNPRRSLPKAVISSILIALVIYVALQIAFLMAVPSQDLAKHGWSGLTFNSPLADLAIAWGVNWLAILLYADAFISPSGTGMIYAATTSRMIHGVQENGHLPGIFGKVDPKTGVPRPALLLNLVVAFIFLAVFRGWGSLAEIVSVATVISYITGPVAVMSLRRVAPDLPRPVMLKAMPVIAPLAMVFGSLVLYWAKWPLTGKVILIMAIGLPVWAWYELRKPWAELKPHLKAGVWMVAYLFVMAFTSFVGSTQYGGRGWLPEGWDLLVVVVIGLVFYFWGVRSAWVNPSLTQARAEAEAAAAAADGDTAVATSA